MSKFVKVIKPLWYLNEGDILELKETVYGKRYQFFYQEQTTKLQNKQVSDLKWALQRGYTIDESIVKDNLGDYFKELTEEEAKVEIINLYSEPVDFETKQDYGYSIKPEPQLESKSSQGELGESEPDDECDCEQEEYPVDKQETSKTDLIKDLVNEFSEKLNKLL